MVAKTRLVVLRPARTDVNKIAVYIGDENLDAGLKFLAAAKATFERLRVHPGIGSLRQSRNKRLRDVRSWPISGFENYLVFYRPIEGGIEIMRVLHGARDVDRIIARG